MTASMTGCRAKLDRAEYHSYTLHQDIGRFLKKHPVKITATRDADWSRYVFHVWNVTKAEDEWSLIFGDCLHNARSALDHLAYQLAIVHLGRDLTEHEARLINFPVSANEGAYKRASTRIASFLRPVDLERIEQLQPHNGWNERLWGSLDRSWPPAPIPLLLETLVKLNNADKHQVIRPVWVAPDNARLPSKAKKLGISFGVNATSPLKEGAEIGKWYFYPEPPEELPPRIDLASCYPLHVSFDPGLFGISVDRILKNCITAVRLVLDIFEPCVEHGADPLPLANWEKEFADLPHIVDV